MSPDAAPRISVILPVFDGADFLAEALQSVLDQDLRSIELIVVDDGSTDGSGAIVQAVGDPRLRYHRQENRGRSAARNRGMSLARGDCLAYLDADDRFLPGALGCMLRALDARPELDGLAAGYLRVDARGEPLGRHRPWLEGAGLDLAACLRRCPSILTALLLRREAALAAGGFDEGMDRAEDWDFYLQLLLSGARLDWLPESVSVYRMHGGNSIRSAGRMRRGLLQRLDKAMADPRLPATLRAEEPSLRAAALLHAATIAYAAGVAEDDVDALDRAASDLALAAGLDPDLFAGSPPPAAEALAALLLQSPDLDPDPVLAAFLGDWPEGLPRPHASTRAARAHLELVRMFQHRRSGNPRGAWRAWLAALRRDPTCLLRPGVAAAGLRSAFESARVA